jgi:uncharacterized protein with GYD domain
LIALAAISELYTTIAWHNPPADRVASGRIEISASVLLCNCTDQVCVTIKDAAERRTAAREKLAVEINRAYLDIGPYGLVIHAEAVNDEALATYRLSLGSKGNVRTTTVKNSPPSTISLFPPRSRQFNDTGAGLFLALYDLGSTRPCIRAITCRTVVGR